MLKKEAKCLIIGRPCPRNSDPTKGDYCPKWWEQSWQNQGGGVRIERGCGETIITKFLTNLDHDMQHMAREASGLKNDARGIIERKLDDALAAMPAFVRQVVQRMWVPQAMDQIQYKPPEHEQPKMTFQDPENRC